MDVHDPKRTAAMAAMFEAGLTLQVIGNTFGISRERVRQIITKYRGLRRGDGGKHVVAKRKSRAARAGVEAACLKSWGCSRAEYQMLRRNGASRAFAFHKSNARVRGIGWEINLWEWWMVWQESGRWERRGRGMENYAMCRNGDVGPYAVSNVRIATNRENIRESLNLRRRAREARTQCLVDFA